MKIKLYLSVLLCLVATSISAMVFDNRFVPLLAKPLYKKVGAAGQIMFQPFLWTGERTYFEEFGQEENGLSAEGEVPLFNINGAYNQLVLNSAVQEAGISSSLFRSDLARTTSSLGWAMNGIIRGQGFGATYFQQFHPHLSWGFNFFIARVKSALAFEADTNDFRRFSPGQFQELSHENNALQNVLGLSSRVATVVGISDIEVYLRCGVLADYTYKMRHFDLGLNFGALIPSALPIDYNNPASIPLGGNGHWGIFVSADGQFDLKENFSCGVLLRLNKRFSKTANRRMVQLREAQNFGVLCGKSEIDPGLTTIFTPYFQIAELRSGFGLQAQYYLVYHSPDIWYDRRRTVRHWANIDLMEQRSEWASEYVTVSALYDFAKDSKARSMQPIVSVAVDIPVQFLVAKRSAKTFGISLMVESTLW